MRKNAIPSAPPLALAFAIFASLAALAGCRSVTIISFAVADGAPAPPNIDFLLVDPGTVNKAVSVRSLDDTVGLYDLAGDIAITTSGCSAGKLVLFDQSFHTLPVDRIVIALHAVDGNRPCPMVHPGKIDYPDSGPAGTGGVPTLVGGGGSDGGGGSPGTPDAAGQGAGGDGPGGAGATGGAGGGGGHTSDDGGGGNGGEGGECDDGGIHDGGVDMGTCMPPAGDPATGDIPAVALNPDCDAYCSDMFSQATEGGVLCPGIYADVAECQRYCSLAHWPKGGGTPARDTGDTIACREAFISMARQMTVATDRAVKCQVAGPGGGQVSDCGQAVGECGKFCNAWSGICGGSRTTCMDACNTNTTVSCRFAWLLRAASDDRYCPLLDLAAPACLVPGC